MAHPPCDDVFPGHMHQRYQCHGQLARRLRMRPYEVMRAMEADAFPTIYAHAAYWEATNPVWSRHGVVRWRPQVWSHGECTRKTYAPWNEPHGQTEVVDSDHCVGVFVPVRFTRLIDTHAMKITRKTIRDIHAAMAGATALNGAYPRPEAL